MALWRIVRITSVPSTTEDECTTDGGQHMRVTVRDDTTGVEEVGVVCLHPDDDSTGVNLLQSVEDLGYTPNDFGL